MIPLVEFPELAQHYAPYFDEVFSAEAFIEFERYISGLVVSENKTRKTGNIPFAVIHHRVDIRWKNRLIIIVDMHRRVGPP